MIIGIPKEIMIGEGRVSLSPYNVEDLIQAGHQILIECDAGKISGFSNDNYSEVGAKIIESKLKIFSESDIILKVKEPIKEELNYFNPGPLLFSYLHLAANENLTRTLIKGKATALGFESVRLKDGQMPILLPMSEIAGRMAIIIGSNLLSIHNKGSGILLGGSAGIPHGYVVIIGGGSAGRSAALAAYGLGAYVIVLEKSISRLRYLNDTLPEGITIIKSNSQNLKESVKLADILIGTILIPNARSPRVVSKEMIHTMKPGSIVIDISIDQGGCIENSRPTTHENPIYIEDGKIFYCVSNMPGAFPKTASEALSESLYPYLADLVSGEDIYETLRNNHTLRNAINIFKGTITIKPIADAFILPFKSVEELIM